LGALLFTAIDRTFPNPALDYANTVWATRSLADDLASIIVAFPLFLLVTWGIVRGVQRQPERLESSVRKWLTYIALVITASTMIGDVVTFFAYFLRGDLNTRFVLKVFTVLVIAGGVFVYYLDSLHRDKPSGARNWSFAVAAPALVVFGVIVGFVQIGSPAGQRSASEDARRLSDLSTLAVGMHTKWLTRSHGQNDFVLPDTIQDLQSANTADPISGQAYDYARLSGTSYRLCASFSQPSPADVPAQWRHKAGLACFVIDAADHVEFVQRAW
jgi:hypothetical protein